MFNITFDEEIMNTDKNIFYSLLTNLKILFNVEVFFKVRKMQMGGKWLRKCNRKRIFLIDCSNLIYFLRLEKYK